MFKKFLLLILASSWISMTANAALDIPQLELEYSNPGVVSFVEPDDILSYRVYYSNLKYEYNLALESELSLCPQSMGLYCIADSVSRKGSSIYLNLKDSFKDATIAIKYRNTDLEYSKLSLPLNLSRTLDKLELNTYSDDDKVYLDLVNPDNVELKKSNFRIFYRSANRSSMRVKDFSGCKLYAGIFQTECASKSFIQTGQNSYVITMKNNLKFNNHFVIAYKDDFSSKLSYSNVVYIKSQATDVDSYVPAQIKNVKVNHKRQVYFLEPDFAQKFYISYTKDYPSYTPDLIDMQECILQEIHSNCAVARVSRVGNSIYLDIKPELPAAFFSVYYKDGFGNTSELSRPVYVREQKPLDALQERLHPIDDLSVSFDGEISFSKKTQASQYHIVHTYGDRSGFLYLEDFPGCRYSGLSCIGYNIREVYNKFYLKIRPEKTGNRIAVYYTTSDGRRSELSNSVFVRAAEALESRIFNDVNFTEYFDAIGFLQQNGHVKGYVDGSFRPYNMISRAEFLKILIEAKFPEIVAFNPNYSCFNDSQLDNWFNKYLCFAKQRGIVAGYADGSFRPGAAITMAEALKVALDTFDIPVASQSSWFAGYITSAQLNSLLPLSLRNRSPYDLLNRGEMAYITYKILTR